ncbi:MAG: LTA synthase family protein, partial [Proteobacteria bacterium]|nr:LTA synthase family protein [Pseudomonadota bacterium]
MKPDPRTSRFPLLRRILNHRLGGVVLLGGLVVGLALATRVALLVTSWRAVDARPDVLIAVFAAGFLQDLALAAFLALPAIGYLVLVPQRVFAHRLHRVVVGVFFLAVLYALCFLGVAEWFFWNEFETRFNFIAVDYLIYTREVLGNIWESYPIPFLLAAIGVVSAGLLLVFWRKADVDAFLRSRTTARERLLVGAAAALACTGFGFAIGERAVPDFANRFDAELARNGVLSFVTAFQANRLDFADFYSTLPETEAFETLRDLLRADDAHFVSDDPRDLLRQIHHTGEELHYNVIQITVESLSSLYLDVLGGKQGLTPNLDAIARAGLLFTNFHATGTRTVRGMESLVLSVPPTPGQSIVKRPHNEDLFTLGSVFRSRGYDTVFFYGGYGYFDNMNAFFAGNGYRVVDRGAVPADAIHFANAWGAADEDLYQWVLQEADRADAAGQPFHHFVMTTSNHRPFTYPDGRIDIPSHSGRAGAVKYTDWAIGHFLDEARKRPWFDRTLF